MLALNQQLTAEQRIAKAIVDITAHDRYIALAGVLMIGTKTVSDDVPTACTNGRDVVFGREMVDALTDAELRFVALHEDEGHKLLRHLTTYRWMYDIDPDLANQACDYYINGTIIDDNREDGFAKMPTGKYQGLYDEKFRKPDGSWMDSAAIFHKLREEQKGRGKPPTGRGKPPTGNGNPVPPNGSGGSDPQGTSSAQGFDEHDWEEANKLSDDEIKELEKDIDVAIRQGSMMAGKLGANGNRRFDELMQPQVNWREVLREFIQTTCTGNDYSTWKRPNRRYIGAGVYLPSGISERVDELVLAIDTSGSISDHAVALFLSEVQSICATVKPDKVRVLYWGHEVVGDESYATHELDTLVKSTEVRGGGGTDVECVVEYMGKHKINPQATIILTDGHLFGDWGTWKCPTLWCVLDNKRATPDTGKVVHIESSNM
tara:strand:- start:375 stop:1670 length:1296 start_codon:yes stop_codon:yes gene_type:complete